MLVMDVVGNLVESKKINYKRKKLGNTTTDNVTCFVI
jgi:hypothetical protein